MRRVIGVVGRGGPVDAVRGFEPGGAGSLVDQHCAARAEHEVGRDAFELRAAKADLEAGVARAVALGKLARLDDRELHRAAANREAERVVGDDAVAPCVEVRANAGVNCLEGVGMVEAPRGTLIHHYKVNPEGAITWANLIVATGHNNLAIGRSVQQVSEKYIDGTKLNEGMLNHVSAVVRAYDPCLSCSTHADGSVALKIELRDAEGTLLDSVEN